MKYIYTFLISVALQGTAYAKPKLSENKQGIVSSTGGVVNNDTSVKGSSFNIINLTKNEDGSLNITPVSSFVGNGVANFEGMSSVKAEKLSGNDVTMFGSVVDQRAIQTVDQILKTQENVVTQLASRGGGLGGFLDQFGIKNNPEVLKTLIQNSTFNFSGVQTAEDIETYLNVQSMLNEINSGNELIGRYTRYVDATTGQPVEYNMINGISVPNPTYTDKQFFAQNFFMKNENGMYLDNVLYGTNANNAIDITSTLATMPNANFDKAQYQTLLDSPNVKSFKVAMLMLNSSVEKSSGYIYKDANGNNASIETVQDRVLGLDVTKEYYNNGNGYDVRFDASYAIMGVSAEDKNNLLKSSGYQSLFSQLPAYFTQKDGQGNDYNKVDSPLDKELSSLLIAGETNAQGNLFSGVATNAGYRVSSYYNINNGNTIVYGQDRSELSSSRMVLGIIASDTATLFNSDINYNGNVSFENYNNGVTIKSGLGNSDMIAFDKNYDSGVEIKGTYNISLPSSASNGSDIGYATWKADVNNDGVMDSLTSRITLDSLDKDTGILKAHVSSIGVIDGVTLTESSLNVYDDNANSVWAAYMSSNDVPQNNKEWLSNYDNNNLTFLIGDFNEDGKADVVGIGEFMHSRAVDVNGDGNINELDSIMSQGTFS